MELNQEKERFGNNQFLLALASLKEAVDNFGKVDEIAQQVDVIQPESLYRTLRDSMIQRFEFTTDLFWKYLKRYLEDAMKIDLEFNAPKPVAREACRAKVVSESDTQKILQMITDRNMSSHIYKEEIADIISSRIPEYYGLMFQYAQKLVP